MALFSRRKSERGNDDALAGGSAGSPEDGDDSSAATARPADGPWDSEEVAEDDDDNRIDLGSLRVPAIDGMQLRMESPGPGGIQAVSLVLGGSTLELRAFAAPRTAGIWDELRADILDELGRAQARTEEVDGENGVEIIAEVPVRNAEGATGTVRVRFLGVDGPRWFLRGVLQGPAAVDDAAARELRDVFRGVVVVRDGAARPPREILPLRVPGAAVMPQVEDLPGLDPLTPGPTIAEVR
ncbi:DUF3710 domain-containing protein [Actinomyces gaoshouyii]|uniref:DUF3710 domain-containing protein n=1 Tax=Actinomyces gaoshouyii TaxID=1960083 RepID=A0A8H9LIY0_9ACTO|nr:DUF3710 domain-containing protein [Actinomyces gaoshouyii]ARD41782.1 hypothetical protein B6G06_05090 [Actinomyces gaoshouyii]GGO97505.1 hypothetical protein GCM10011612_10190 [Actinomyces gaoshouyii]